jgi:hypothetical protein
LAVFALAGAVAGWIAQRAVEESVQATIAAGAADVDAARRISDV